MKIRNLRKGSFFNLFGITYKVIGKDFLGNLIALDIKAREECCFIGNYEV